MSIEIREVKNRKELKKFIEFPMQLYKGNPYYVPSLIREELSTLDTHKNQVFIDKKAQAKYYLAFKEQKIVGRIATIVNWREVKEQGISRARFGWLDFIDDKEVSNALLQKAIDFAKENNLKEIEGPVGLTNLDKAGLLTKGFDKVATMVTLYNYPYYEKHLLHHGFETAKEWVEYEMFMPEKLPEKFDKFTNLIQSRYQLRIRKLKDKKDLQSIVDPMFDLLDKTYGHLSSYVPLTPHQVQQYKDKYINFVNPDFVTVIESANKKMVAFAVTMPSYSEALQKSRGKIFPFGWYHFLKASQKNTSAAFYLIGIAPEYQDKGLTALIFSEMYKTFKKYGITYLETNPELIENTKIQSLWKDYQPRNHKRRKSFKKLIT